MIGMFSEPLGITKEWVAYDQVSCRIIDSAVPGRWRVVVTQYYKLWSYGEITNDARVRMVMVAEAANFVQGDYFVSITSNHDIIHASVADRIVICPEHNHPVYAVLDRKA